MIIIYDHKIFIVQVTGVSDERYSLLCCSASDKEKSVYIIFLGAFT